MRRFTAVVVLGAFVVAGCSEVNRRSAPPGVAKASAPFGLSIPPTLALPVPPPPPARTPAAPPASRNATVADTAHATFFTGEAPLGGADYYLALPNGTPFGYYTYLADSNYIYHYDMRYEYVLDANDGGGVYLYDFASLHWWYTGRSYPFPYVYDFSLKHQLYYYADTHNAGHYTSSPRLFYDFATNQIILLPNTNPTPTPSPSPTATPVPT